MVDGQPLVDTVGSVYFHRTVLGTGAWGAPTTLQTTPDQKELILVRKFVRLLFRLLTRNQ